MPKNDSHTKSGTPTHPRSGGPPRWVVVVLVLAIGVGMALQGKPPAISPAPPETGMVKLANEVVLTGMPVGSNPKLSHNSSFLYDAATNRVVVLYAAGTSSIIRDWYIQISDDGGTTFRAPVHVGVALPVHGAALVSGLGQTLHVVTFGIDPAQPCPLTLLKTVDDGHSWQVLDSYQSGSLLNAVNHVDAVRWEDALIVCYVEEKVPGHPKLMARRFALDTGAVDSFDLMELSADKDHFVVPPIATRDRLCVNVIEAGFGPTQLHTLVLSPDQVGASSQPTPPPALEFTAWPELGIDPNGDPFVAFEDFPSPHSLSEILPALASGMLNPKGPPPDLTHPGILYQWDETRGWIAVDESMVRPRWGTLWDASAVDGLVLASSAQFASPKQGWAIDRIDLSAGGGTHRWTVELPQQVKYGFPKLRLRTDGAAIIIAERTNVVTQSRDLVLLITEPLPGMDATEMSAGSPLDIP